MLTRFALLIGLIAASLGLAREAHAERRVALVIGNANYIHAAALRNPRNDAREMAEILKGLGFEVQLGLDLDQQSFARALEGFARSLEGADVALFFYAGHGLQINEKNYLVSVNAQLANEFLVSSETIEVDSVLRLMESKVPVNLVFLDACRNNPLAEDLRKNLVALKRSAVLGRGLARIEPTGRDTLIAFAAAPGQEAADGASQHSPFTGALLKHITTPNLEVSVMLKKVAADVREATKNAQRPQQLSDMSRTFYFAKAEPAVAQATERPQPSAESPAALSQYRTDDRALEVAFWNAAQNANQCEAIRAYLQRYPNGIFVELGRLSEQRLCSTGRRIDVVSTPPKQEPPPEAPQASAPVAPAPAPASPKTEVAALPTPAEVSPQPQAAIEDLARPIQAELDRLGCDPGKVDGIWGEASRDAARRFKRHAKASLDVDEPSQDLLDALRERKSRVCPLECGPGERVRGGVCVAVEPPRRNRRHEETTRDRRRHRPAAAEVRRPWTPPHEAARPAPAARAPERCVIDLGYGRTANCDAGGGR
ncbi:MAG TPA: caspase family protein [Xanthobacteraceae bacterium]|nr:caspase family protein [Xanthobacteraceae bacterium]